MLDFLHLSPRKKKAQLVAVAEALRQKIADARLKRDTLSPQHIDINLSQLRLTDRK
jgi:hypothetical protein